MNTLENTSNCSSVLVENSPKVDQFDQARVSLFRDHILLRLWIGEMGGYGTEGAGIS